MSTTLRLTIAQYEAMIASGAFDQIEKRIEFIHGELRETSPVGPIHYDYFAFLTRWSVANSPAQDGNVQIQSAILIGDSMPEPDVMWLRPRRYGFDRPKPEDALLLIEVADSSLRFDSTTKKNALRQRGHSGVLDRRCQTSDAGSTPKITGRWFRGHRVVRGQPNRYAVLPTLRRIERRRVV